MAYTSITDCSTHFQAHAFTGNASAGNSITLSGNSDLAADLIWLKDRVGTNNHSIYDIVRGTSKAIRSSTSGAETTTSGVTAFSSNGFTLGDNAMGNANNAMISWLWKAGGSPSSNTEGSATASVSVNTTAGFSIASVTGNSMTFGHGLGVAPDVVIYKPTSASGSWGVVHKSLGITSGYLNLGSTGAFVSGSGMIDAVSSSLVTVGGNVADATNIYYCFAEKKGYSKFGIYSGDSNTDGPLVYTGFAPEFVMVKSSSHESNWMIYDNARDTSNTGNRGKIYAESNVAENSEDGGSTTSNICDFLSNGFKMRHDAGGSNGSGRTYIYLAFAKEPVVSSNEIPATAI